MKTLHPLLRNQIATHLGPQLEWPDPLHRFVEAVDDGYQQWESDRILLERSLDLSSQECLQANSDMLAVIQAFPDLFLWVTPDGRILGCRAQDSSDLVCPPAALVGKRLQDIPDRDAASRFTQALQEIASGARLATLEYSLDCSGEQRYYEARLARVNERQLLAIVRNIGNRRRTEAALEQSLSLLRATLESTTDGILVVDSTGRIASFNQKFIDLWGIPDAVVATRDDNIALDFVVDRLADPEAFLAKVRSLYEQPEAESFDVILLKDGQIFERYSVPQRIAGSSVGRVWSFRDVTDRRRAEWELAEREKELRQAQKMEAVGMLAGGIAHDFNNLLTAITGYASLVLEQMGESHALRADVEEIQKAGDSAAALTHQLLAFSRRQILQPRILDMNAVVLRTDALLRRLIGEDIELVSRLSPTLHRVNVDPGQIEQIVMNLAVNARDAMPQGGKLTIETADVDLDRTVLARRDDPPPGRYVMLAVSDSGVGIPEGSLPHIFEPFYTTKRRGEGTGLGLATVYGIVKQSGGAIWVDTEPGRGTTFKIYLPAAVQSRDEAVAATMPAIVGGTETILIAEDQLEVRSVTQAVLTRHGYTVLSADCGDQALQMAREFGQPIHLLITDVVMPVMSGPDLVARLHEIFPAVRVLYTSGYIDDGIVRNGIVEAEVAFIQKPFAPSGLLSKVREVLDVPAEVV